MELEKKKILVTQLQRECEEFLGKIVEQKTSASERERVTIFSIWFLSSSSCSSPRSKSKPLAVVLAKRKFDVKRSPQLLTKSWPKQNRCYWKRMKLSNNWPNEILVKSKPTFIRRVPWKKWWKHWWFSVSQTSRAVLLCQSSRNSRDSIVRRAELFWLFCF